MNRLLFAALVCFVQDSAVRAQPAKAATEAKDSVVWHDLKDLEIEGKGFQDTKAFYDRLPARAEKTVRAAVWGLSRHSAGMCVRFVTDATTIHARWTLTSPKLEMVHMPATGVSGLDLYARLDNGKWHWVNVGRPSAAKNEHAIVAGLAPGKREFLLYLPLYNGVSSVEVGVPKGTSFTMAPPRSPAQRKPIVFYGTSITHGACASRPGMVHTAIIGRHFDWSVVNLGFSGNGRMEKEVGELMAEIDAAVYVIDCLPNMGAKEVEQNTEPLVHLLRKARPATPILLVEDRTYTNAPLVPSVRQRNDTSRAALKKSFEKLVAGGVKNLHYLPGEHLLGDDSEGTVDNSHPNDLGFMRQAEAMSKALAPLLK